MEMGDLRKTTEKTEWNRIKNDIIRETTKQEPITIKTENKQSTKLVQSYHTNNE